MTASTGADTFTWNAGDGFWSNSSNWSPSGPPTNNSTVVFDASSGDINSWDDVSNLTVTLQNYDPRNDLQVGFPTDSFANLTLKNGSTNAGEIEVRGDGNLVIAAKLINTGGVIQADSGFSAYNIELDGATISGGGITAQSDAGIEVTGSSTIAGAYISLDESKIGITGGSTLTLKNTSVDGESLIGFDSTGNTLAIDNPYEFGGTIYGLAGNTIDLTSLPFASLTGETLQHLNGATYQTLSLVDGKQHVSFDLMGSFAANFNPPSGTPGFVFAADATGGTDITYVMGSKGAAT